MVGSLLGNLVFLMLELELARVWDTQAHRKRALVLVLKHLLALD